MVIYRASLFCRWWVMLFCWCSRKWGSYFSFLCSYPWNNITCWVNFWKPKCLLTSSCYVQHPPWALINLWQSFSAMAAFQWQNTVSCKIFSWYWNPWKFQRLVLPSWCFGLLRQKQVNFIFCILFLLDCPVWFESAGSLLSVSGVVLFSRSMGFPLLLQGFCSPDIVASSLCAFCDSEGPT